MLVLLCSFSRFGIEAAHVSCKFANNDSSKQHFNLSESRKFIFNIMQTHPIILRQLKTLKSSCSLKIQIVEKINKYLHGASAVTAILTQSHITEYRILFNATELLGANTPA
jgi:hypothetical protein